LLLRRALLFPEALRLALLPRNALLLLFLLLCLDLLLRLVFLLRLALLLPAVLLRRALPLLRLVLPMCFSVLRLALRKRPMRHGGRPRGHTAQRQRVDASRRRCARHGRRPHDEHRGSFLRGSRRLHERYQAVGHIVRKVAA
jgi:membrane protein implicated in regulation of membrane protease activity